MTSSPVTPLPEAHERDELDDLVISELRELHEHGWKVRPTELQPRPRIGIVFGAGGVLGNAYLAGALAALWEATGFEPRTASVIVGTSAGSVHAALYGSGIPALFTLWRSRGGMLPDDLFTGPIDAALEAPVPLPWVDEGEGQTLREIFTPARALPRLGPASKTLALKSVLRPWAYRPEVILSAWLPEGVLTNAAIGRALQRLVPSGWAAHPRTWITAVNLRTGTREVFGRPSAPRAHLDRAVRASCAIPGFYRPVRIGRDRYVDGGMHSPSNADLVADLELDLALIISPMSSLEGHAAAGLIDRYVYPLRHVAGRRLAGELRELRERDVPTYVIQPSARDLEVFSRNLMDTRPRQAVAERALETTRDALTGPVAREAVTLLRLAARTHSSGVSI